MLLASRAVTTITIAAWICLVMALVSAAACRPAKALPAAPQKLRLSTGAQGGGFFPLGNQIAAGLSLRMPHLDVQVIPSAGAVANVTALQEDRADLGFTFADVAYIAYSGQLEGEVTFDRLRGIAVLQLTPISLVARADLPIQSPSDLRGRTVGVGPAGSGTTLTANLILGEYGLDHTTVHLETMGFQEASTRLLDGTLDAMFDNAINQADSLRRAIDGGARLVPIEGPAVDNLRREYPFLKLAVISSDLYPRLARPVHTIGVDGLLVCRRDLDEALVYELTKQLYASLRAINGQGSPRWMEMDQAAATPIPLHDGAARFYRERELSR